ncbi:hypothetical protein [Enterocloster bolteae]|jgi:hypothetical protein|uniref:hypothetical protein n=1 Tax=Enterocloster bolteae TaxID=208479 RepID=UPI002675BA08|nr:hypothetical protein [Enterocloster bolteae]
MANKEVMIAVISLKVGAPHLVLLRSSLFSVKIKMKNFSTYKTIGKSCSQYRRYRSKGIGDASPRSNLRRLTQRENRENE